LSYMVEDIRISREKLNEGVTLSQMSNGEKMRRDPQREFLEQLKEVIKEEAIEAWLQQPNMVFGGRTPQQLIDEENFGLLERMLSLLRSGEPSG
jgi:hypothetical protein